ncbi:Peptidase family C69 [uncultured archaeon]|nr:Peptidase family C69 [uncultured archaeon]
MRKKSQPSREKNHGCTIFVVTPGASADGSMFTGHTNDGFGPGVVGHEVSDEGNKLVYIPAADHKPKTKRLVQYDPNSGSDDQSGGDNTDAPQVSYIEEVDHTFGYLTGSYGIMNEHQLMSSECTDFAKMEPDYIAGERIFYSSELSNIAMERCKLAREAVELVGSLIDQHGVYGTGETLIFADTKEAWVLEMCGCEPKMFKACKGCKGLWVAKKVPDGQVFVASNTFRIREVDTEDPDMLYSGKLHDVARELGWDGRGKVDWLKTFSTGEYSHPYYSLARLYSVYRRLAPSRNFSPYVMDTWSREYPFSLVPDRKRTLEDTLQIFRDHYEGTVYDLTTGLAAGPYGNPYRDDGPFDAHDLFTPGEIKLGSWPRPVSAIFCSYSYITQARSWLLDPIGGVCWFGFAQPSETCYIPVYAGANSLPQEFNCGKRSIFDHSSGWWAFNFTTNWAMLRYCQMIEDIKLEQKRIEDEELSRQKAIDEKALEIYHAKDGIACTKFLTDYCSRNALSVISDWWKLSDMLVVKYSNGLVNDVQNGVIESTKKGYPNEWLSKVGYQYGPRIYQYKELQEIGCVEYVGKIENVLPGTELEYIKKHQTCQSERHRKKQQESGQEP